MLPDPLIRAAFGPILLAACLSAAVLGTPPALAQGGGESGAARPADGTGAPGSPAVTGQGSGGRPGQALPNPPGPGPQPGLAVDDLPRPELLEQQRAAGVAAPAEQRREQLQDLNEIARQIAPSVPVPAPGLEGAGPSR